MTTLTPLNRLILFVLLLFIVGNSCNRITERLDGFAVHGIDVSHYQKHINWNQVAAEEVHFVFVKATEGRTYRDSIFCHNWDEMKRIGVIHGAYHFYVPSVHPLEQANNYIGTVDLAEGDLPPVLDFEKVGDKSPDEIRADLQFWLDEVEGYYGIQPIIYTNQKLYYQYIHGYFSDYVLWVARYNTIAPDMPQQQPWTFWQYGNKGQMPGIEGPVDFNVFKGSMEDLQDLTYRPQNEDTRSSVSFSSERDFCYQVDWWEKEYHYIQ